MCALKASSKYIQAKLWRLSKASQIMKQRCSEQQRAGNRVDGEDGKGNIMKGLALANLFPSCNTK